MIICISMRAPGGECAVLGLHKADRKSVKRQGIVGFRLYVSPVIGFKEVVNLVLSEECLGIRPVWIECEAIIIAIQGSRREREYQIPGYRSPRCANQRAHILTETGKQRS